MGIQEMCLIGEAPSSTISESGPRSPPSSATVCADHGDVLADELADGVDEGLVDPARPMLPSARLAALPCVSASSRAGSDDAEQTAESHRLGDQADLRGEERVVDQLDQLTRAGRGRHAGPGHRR